MQLSRNAATAGWLQGAVEEAQLISWPTPGKVRATLAGVTVAAHAQPRY